MYNICVSVCVFVYARGVSETRRGPSAKGTTINQNRVRPVVYNTTQYTV